MRAIPLTALVLHVVALALWLGGVVTSGLAAAIIFPTMKGLDPRLPEYAAYTGDHWMLAAGKVAARIFHATDLVQGVCAVVTIATAGVLLGTRAIRVRPLAPLAWLVGVVGALAVLGTALFWLRPEMDANLHASWDAALAGDNPTAEAARQAFSARHPLASNLMSATALLVLMALTAVIPSTMSARGRGDEGGDAATIRP